ncbi:MAG TPA: ATP-binding protein [Vicinamibacteria bacterium]|nr:ATP-binding protein [Vicinamibacteria bacterium]
MDTGPSTRADRFPVTEEERALFVRSLHTVLWISLLGTLAGAAIYALLMQRRGSLVLPSLFAATVPLFSAFWLVRRGWLRAAAVLVLLDNLALATLLLYSSDGLQDIAILVYPGVLAAAGLLLQKRWFVLIVVLAMASIAAIGWGQAHGLVYLADPEHRSWIPGDVLIAALLLGFTATLVMLMVDSLRRSLAQAVRRAGELSESEARYRALFETSRVSELAAVRERTIAEALIDSLPGAFFLLDTGGRFLRWNRSFARELGYTDEEIQGMPALDVVAPHDRQRLAERMAALLREGGSAAMELQAVSRDGRAVPYFVTGTRVELEGRTLLLGTALDISERRRLQEQLYRAQKMEAIGSLAGGIAHDFNNILFAMSAVTELARRTVADRPPVVAHLDQLLQSVSRARDLVAKILAFSRRTAPVRETLDLRTVAEEVSKLLRVSCPAGVRVHFSALSSPVLVLGDPSEIHQVVLNLGTNAVHAVGESGGTVEVSVGWAEPTGGAAPLALLRVRDNGRGIPESIRHRIFDPYFTTKPAGEGTGLGLAVVHGIVSDAGGHVEVESDEGRGTRVDVLLPAAAAPQAAAAPTPRAGVVSPAGHGETLALVDDEPLVATVLADALEDLGYQVEVFVDSRAACRAIGSGPLPYDLVITDEAMPHLGGRDLIRAVRDRVPDQKFLLMSAFPASLDPAAPGSPDPPRLAKPVTLHRLAEVIRRCLDGGPPLVGPD